MVLGSYNFCHDLVVCPPLILEMVIDPERADMVTPCPEVELPLSPLVGAVR